MVVLGGSESYFVLLHTGKLSSLMRAGERMRIESHGFLLPFPQAIKDASSVLASPTALHKDTVVTMESMGLGKPPYTALISKKEGRKKTETLSTALLSYCLPPHSVLHFIDDVMIVSPALCLLLLARKSYISDAQLIFAASQLCSRYAYDTSPNHELIERIPHTTKSRIEGFLAQLEQINDTRAPKGTVRLRKALRYVHDGARSPREIGMDMLMSLPARAGGLAMPSFETNKRIELTGAEQRELNKQHLESDFVWEQQRLILEYNGGVHDAQREADSLRTNVLRDKGYTVEVMTKSVFDNYESYTKFMKRLEDPLDFKLPQSANRVSKHRNLHAQILGISRHACEAV